jgi:hypothetical protein
MNPDDLEELLRRDRPEGGVRGARAAWDRVPPPVAAGIGVAAAVLVIVLALLLLRPDGDPVADAPTTAPQADRPTSADRPDLVTIPRGLVGASLADVSTVLANLGLRLERVAEPVAGVGGVTPGEVLDVRPAAGQQVEPDSAVTVTYAVPPPPTTPPATTPATTPDGTPSASPPAGPAAAPTVELVEGDPAGSGCTPGAGVLPDGQWVGYLEAEAGSAQDGVAIDLVCYDSATGTARNDNPALRGIELATEVRATCAGRVCEVADLLGGALVLVVVEEGVVTVVQSL